MLELIIGRTAEEAKALSAAFMKMIKGDISDEELEMLEEAGALQDISHMPARVKCAVLGWHTMEELLGDSAQ
jgi:nitrogen fixation NifU-like protein